MLARSFDAVVGSTCVSKSSGPVLISGNDTIRPVLFVYQLHLVVLVSLVRQPTLRVFLAIPVPLLLNMVYSLNVLVPPVGLLVHLLHVFPIVRFSNLI